MATLWIVATPIGNLEDITLRALSVLKEADAIACEDTRHSLGLLSHFGISKPLLSCYAYREEKGARSVIAKLDAGQNVAYVSDAGTPSLSDPGSLLVREALAAGHTVVPLPGPSAFACLLSAAGMGGKSVTFDGFLSPKAGRRRSRLRELMGRDEAALVYESPFRIVKLMEDVAAIDPGRPVCIGREMTKLHEEFLRGSASEILADLKGRQSIKGEFAVLIAGSRGTVEEEEEDGAGEE